MQTHSIISLFPRRPRPRPNRHVSVCRKGRRRPSRGREKEITCLFSLFSYFSFPSSAPENLIERQTLAQFLIIFCVIFSSRLRLAFSFRPVSVCLCPLRCLALLDCLLISKYERVSHSLGTIFSFLRCFRCSDQFPCECYTGYDISSPRAADKCSV